jgi:hypothetical protein
MKTASMVLGIIGGAISIIFGLLLILGGVSFMDDGLWEDVYDYTDGYEKMSLQAAAIQSPTGIFGTLFLSMGISAVAAGALGIAGGCIVKKKNIAAGVMMIIAAAISVFAFFNLITVILFILGGVFALKKEPPAMPPYPPYPYYAYPQYPQYPYYQYPQYAPYPAQQIAPPYAESPPAPQEPGNQPGTPEQ